MILYRFCQLLLLSLDFKSFSNFDISFLFKNRFDRGSIITKFVRLIIEIYIVEKY